MSQLECGNSVVRFESVFGEGFSQLLRDEFSSAKKIIFTDETVYDLWGEKFITHFEELHQAEVIVIPTGEENKNLEICNQIWGALSEYGIGRHDLMINLGGGVITDMGGFISSTYKRGMPFVNVPTTLLAQVDASVGGKCGIDHGPYKNQIGVFAWPKYVYVDSDFLSTLEGEQLKSGYAEMLKHGLIEDREHFNLVSETNPEDLEKLKPLIEHSVRIKAKIVDTDPQEAGERKKLNLGHTIGHAIEGFALQSGNPILHGYAVAYGIKGESYLAYMMGRINQEELYELQAIIDRVYPSIDSSLLEKKELLQLMQNDKKNESDEINFTLLDDDLGSCIINQSCLEENIVAALEFIPHPSE